jgi:hypothetical protein
MAARFACRTICREFDALDTPILALSADDQPEAWGTVEQLGLEFTVLYGLDPEATSRVIGCYTGMHRRPAAHPSQQRSSSDLTGRSSTPCFRAARSADSRPATR